MGFWGKLGSIFGKVAPIAASFIPGAGPLASLGTKALVGGLKAAPGVLGAIGVGAGAGALAGKVIKDLSSEDENAKLLRESGTKFLEAGRPAYESALGTYGKLASGDKGTLAQFTGTGINEMNRATQNQIDRARSTQSRGGSTAKVLAEAPGQLERSALGARLDARKLGIEKQGTLGLAGSQLGSESIGRAGSLGLQRRSQNIGIAKDIGEGVGTILDKTGVWGKLGGAFGKIFGGDNSEGGFSDRGPGAPALPGFSGAGVGAPSSAWSLENSEAPSTSFSSLDLGKPINLDLFGQPKTISDPFTTSNTVGSSWGQMFNK